MLKHGLVTAFLAVSTAVCRPTTLLDQSRQHTLISPAATLRNLTSKDIPDVTSLIIAAFAPGPVYHYLAPDYPANQQGFWECMNSSLTDLWEARNHDTTFGKVITVGDTPASVSFWNMRTDERSRSIASAIWSVGDKCAPPPGGNGTRIQDTDRQYSEIDKTYFQNAYTHQLYLNLLATHPNWDGHGFAARHLQWGKELSIQLSHSAWPVTLLATPAGWPVYTSSGFESVANVSVKMLDDLGELWFEVMKWQGGAVSSSILQQ